MNLHHDKTADVLINNAGINVGPDERKHVDEFNDKWWNAIINVDLTGTYYCTQNAIPYMTGTVIPVDGGWTCGGFAIDF